MNFNDLPDFIDNEIDSIAGAETFLDGYVGPLGGMLGMPVDIFEELANSMTAYTTSDELAGVVSDLQAIDAILDQENLTVSQLDEIQERLNSIRETGWFEETLNPTGSIYSPHNRYATASSEDFFEAMDAVAQERYGLTGILGNGAAGDNNYNDDVAYDYTLDLDDDHWGWADNVSTNEDGETSPHPVGRNDNDGGSSGAKPVIIDLDGDGVELSMSGLVNFDWDDDGFEEQTAWVGADDGFLVLDLNSDGTRGAGDGRIDQAEELAFALWGEAGMTDLQALAQATDEDGNLIFDSNADGILDNQDDVWAEFRIWQDLDQDGVTDQGELFVLAGVTASAWYDQNGDGIESADEIFDLEEVQTSQQMLDGTITENGTISSINLSYDNGGEYGNDENAQTIFGNTLWGLASYTATNADGGETIIDGGVGDVELAFNPNGWRRIETTSGYRVEFESGDTYTYREMDGLGLASADLTADALDGVAGDYRDNILTAANSIRSVALSGGDGNDSLVGGENDDLISGDEGADTIIGGAGNDILFVDADDLNHGHVDGGGGVDSLFVQGTSGVSFALNELNVEIAAGSEGNDSISGAGMYDDLRIFGRDGDDTITGGAANDNLDGGDGDDSITGGTGSDFIRGSVGDDNVSGENGDDFLSGGDGDDQVSGGNGDDFLTGGAGNDSLQGGGQDDSINGGVGDDTLNGGFGDDWLEGGDGNDSLYFWKGDDTLIGGEGDDTFYLAKDAQYGTTNGENTNWGWAVFQGGTGHDVFVVDRAFSLIDSLIHIAGSQWQLFDHKLATGGKVVIDLMDFEEIQFSDGTTIMLGDDTTTDNSDNYVRVNRDAFVGDSNARYLGIDQVTYHAGNLVYTGSLQGWTGDDLLQGDAQSNLVNGGMGSDTLAGYVGNDTLQGGNGSDEIWGGFGDDSLSGGSGADTMIGGDGNDILIGYTGADQIWGNVGHDSLVGGNGGDQLAGGDGDDTLLGQDGHDRLYGGAGHDSLVAGTGSDLLAGEAGDDILYGNQGSDELYGGEGADTLIGGDGFDLLYGGDGNDSVSGGNDDDYLFGGDGDDTLLGGEGRDVLNGGAGADLLDGGTGLRDVANYEGSEDAVSIDLSAGTASGGDAENDTLTAIEGVFGSAHNDTLNGDALDNVIEGNGGNDAIDGGAGHDLLAGNDGDDTINGQEGSDRIWGGAGNDRLVARWGDDQLLGGDGDDSLFGGFDDDKLWGGNGDDLLDGGADNGSDSLEGGAGADELRGGAGNDELYGGNGDDTLDGGDDDDEMFGHGGNDIMEGGTDSGADTLDGGSGNDTIDGGDGNDFLKGATGQDSVVGGNGDDTIWGGNDNDVLRGNLGNDRMIGGNGDDTVDGGYGDDRLYGGSGYDRLFGGNDAGSDTLSGQDGIDHFVFNATSAFGDDVITDFDAANEIIQIMGLSYADLSFVSSADGVMVQSSQGSIMLDDVVLADLGQDNFVFV
jgi:Ca2+-binding RTX toxin-like protein